ncbi:MAG TPA: thiosulfate sulfurtransferase GlpE [Aliidiomarina sp.]|nr:thiosulfate sulfurtransferase GlpE [Aliidiomarina sp.]
MSECQNININDAHQRLTTGELAVADIRDPQTFQQGHIAGAVNINNDNLGDFINDNADKAVLVVCYHGVSSQRAAQYMLEQGVAEAYSLSGGMTAWAETLADELIVGA